MIKVLTYLLLGLMTQTAIADNSNTEDPGKISQKIKEMDHRLFDIGFNQCNFDVWKSIVSEDLEFYDDRTGLNTSFEKEVRAFKDKCSKPFDVTRKLVSSEVHELRGYGAFQTGKHNFYVDDKLVETAQFAVIWQQTDDSWVVRRIVSYDHQAIE